jgi:hypothetical protein
MDGIECGRRLYAAFFAMSDVIHPVAKSIQIDSANRDALCCYVQQAPKETFMRRLEIDDDYGIQLHTFVISPHPWLIQHHYFRLTLDNQLRLCQSLYILYLYTSPQFAQHESPLCNIN